MNYQDTQEHEPKPLSPAQLRTRVLRVALGNINFAIPEVISTVEMNPAENTEPYHGPVDQSVNSTASQDELTIRRAASEAQSLAMPSATAKEGLYHVPEAS